MIEIKIFGNVDFADFTFIEGFPGVGLVGPMSISYIINQLNLEYVGYIKSDLFPPLVSIHNNIPLPPVRLYYSKEYKILTLFAEVGPIAEDYIYEISDGIYNFIKSQKIHQVISISGVPVHNTENKGVFGIASTNEGINELVKMGINKVGEGVATGISSLIITQSTLDNLLDFNLLIPVNPDIIDPKYAELAIQSINKILNIDINISELDKEAKIVESKIKDLVKKSKESKAYNNDSGNVMYV